MFAESLYQELRARLTIDKLRLDDELTETAMLIQTACEAAADATQVRDAAKNDYDVTCASAARRLRETAEKAPSEEKLKSLIILEPEVRAALGLLDDARRDSAYWQSLADSMRDKASLLRRYAELTIAGFLAPNSVNDRRREDLNAGRTFRPR